MAKGSDARLRGRDGDGTGEPARCPAGPGGRPPWVLSPSDFAFLWDQCPRCFYNKVILKKPRPRTPFPVVFGRIDRAMKDFFVGQRAEDVVAGAPRGVIGKADNWVRSGPIAVPRSSTALVIRGRVDALAECDDGTTGIIDFKTVEPKESHLDNYSRQLHAYALALEHPKSGRPATVSAMGLVCFRPDVFESRSLSAALHGGLRWFEVVRDGAAFRDFLVEMASVLEKPEPPPAASGCQWCRWLDLACVAD